MKITDSEQLCPYTGLRSFTEDESLYFKGRDEQVDLVTKQLEERKFLMLTGASGEGKSSLIYAGLIPNARAGFFKAKYTNWKVVDFRPERSPVSNLSNALGEVFSIQPQTIETEMRRGFSALVDLYVNSKFYIAEEDLPAGELERKQKSRSGSNLLILVDQFEEFFTNPENYYNESPSQDSQIVVNLVLETARIALQQNLPIYVVCTMRSDYIGQCSSFRGLAEYIGYSQFFVPRLKRNELKQVIEDPAVLSGNRITQRLTDRLVYDLSEGVDQLPILQHALSQIWLEASHGSEEMDLIHYAMVGGMPASELPPEEKIRFDKWFSTIPEFQQRFYAETGLSKVIENHASRLYERAASEYNEKHPTAISGKDAKNVIALTFSCLTRIDNSRAVRNRMTLAEITAIINKPELSSELIGDILSIFREEGNSFLRPFMTDKSTINGETVLDITHESLIRNWGKLNTWAANEYNFYSTFLDLKKQLDRWKTNGKSAGYLLPIGPLTYFENWYATCRPNTGWINRYGERSQDGSQRWKEAEQVLSDIKEYLGKSANHVSVSRAFVRYGAGKIALGVSIFALLILCGWYWYDAHQKKNDQVLRRIQNEAVSLLSSSEVTGRVKARYLVQLEKLNNGDGVNYLNSIQNQKEKRTITIETYKQLMWRDRKFSGPAKKQLINAILKDVTTAETSPATVNDNLDLVNRFIYTLAYDNYYNPDSATATALYSTSAGMSKTLLKSFGDPAFHNAQNTLQLNVAIQQWLTFGKPSQDDIQSLINLMSPLAGDSTSKKTFEVFFPKGTYEPHGIRPLDYNGGYHTLASLYAAVGDLEKIKLCFEELANQPDYFSGKLLDDYTNVIGYMYQHGHRQGVPNIIELVQKLYPTIAPIQMYGDLLGKSAYISTLFRLNFSDNNERLLTEDGRVALNLCLADRQQFKIIAEDYERIIGDIKDISERNFQLAIKLKKVAVFEHKYHFDRSLPIPEAALNEMLVKAWSHFKSVDENHLSEVLFIPYQDIAVFYSKKMTRRQYFIYPDYMGGYFNWTYHSDFFFKFLSKNNHLNDAYKTADDLELISFWASNIEGINPFVDLRHLENVYPVAESSIASAVDFGENHSAGNNFDASLMLMMLANKSFERNDTTAGLEYFSRIKVQDYVRSAGNYDSWRKTRFLNDATLMVKNIAITGRTKEAFKFLEEFPTPPQRLIGYTLVADKVYDDNFDSKAFIFLDSAFAKWKSLPNPNVNFQLEYRNRLIRVTEKIGGEKMKMIGDDIQRNARESRRFITALARTQGSCQRYDYYAATLAIIPSLTETQDLECKTEILKYAASEKQKLGTPTSDKIRYAPMDDNDYILYYGILF